MPPTFNNLVTRLWCLQWPAGSLPADALAHLATTSVVVDTCLRQLAFGLTPRPQLPGGDAGELRTGACAYRLLVEVASGLRSAVPGETNVFGQFRRSWEAATGQLAPETRRQLEPLVQAVQADTRALRREHLEGVGGSSYGSLVRALLAPRPDARILFVGAGALTRSMLPLFAAFPTGVWNHRPVASASIPVREFAPGEADAAADWATEIVFTTPRDAGHDLAWRQRLQSRTLRGLVHLGHRSQADSPRHWPGVGARFDLDHVFALAATRNARRAHQLESATRACGALVAARLGDPRPLRIPGGLAHLWA